jgi:transposase
MWKSQSKSGHMKLKKTKKTEPKQVFTVEMQYEVVQRVLSGELTKSQAMAEYGIKGKSCVLYWMRKFEGQNDYRKGGEKLPFRLMDDQQYEKELGRMRQRIKDLESDLRTERLRAGLWEKVVEIAERDLGLDIRKKYGARQSENILSGTKDQP